MDHTDEDGDSTMHSSPEDQEDDLFPAHDAPSTPKLTQTSELSPPASRGRNPALPTGTSNVPASFDPGATDPTGGASRAEGARAGPGTGTGAAGGKKAAQAETQTHAASGYTWARAEDGPGWAWRNKKAQEDTARTWDTVVDKDRMIRGAYGDVLALQAASGS